MISGNPDDLTPTERSCERAQAKEAREVANKCGGCFCCLKRDRSTEAFGLAECGLKPQARFKKHGCTFHPDYSRLYPGRHE